MTLQRAGEQALTPGASIRLDAARALAAIAVMIGHLKALMLVPYEQVTTLRGPNACAYFLTSLGHYAVMAFFILSGYFIASSVLRRAAGPGFGWSWYLTNRLTRLWIVLLPALALGLILDRLGIHFFGDDGVYGGAGHYAEVVGFPVASRLDAGTLVGNAAFLQNIRVQELGSNVALWSLAYEFWYYIAFPLLYLAAVGRTVSGRVAYLAGAAGVFVFVGDTISLYFLLWALGAALALTRGIAAPAWTIRPLQVGSLLGLAGALVVAKGPLDGKPGDCLVGAAFAVVAYVAIHFGNDAEPRGARLWKRTAAFSFTLYALHFPMLVFVRGWLDERGAGIWQPTLGHWLIVVTIAAGTLTIAWGVASVTEDRTGTARGWVQKRLGDREHRRAS